MNPWYGTPYRRSFGPKALGIYGLIKCTADGLDDACWDLGFRGKSLGNCTLVSLVFTWDPDSATGIW